MIMTIIQKKVTSVANVEYVPLFDVHTLGIATAVNEGAGAIRVHRAGIRRAGKEKSGFFIFHIRSLI